MAFPGAVADRAEADYAIIGAPLDASSTFQPGSRFGPGRVRTYAQPFEDYDRATDSLFSDLAVHDHGDVHPTDDVAGYLSFLEGTVSEYVDAGAVPLLVGGEHTVAVAAVRALSPDVFVCLDAHLDLRESFRGNAYSHATVTRHALEVADEAILLGVRAGSEREWTRAGAVDVTVVPPGEVADWEPAFADRRVYLSVDLDAVDPGFAPGTGTPEPFGLQPTAAREVVRSIAPAAVGCDVVEITDRDHGETASMAAKLLRGFVYAHAAG